MSMMTGTIGAAPMSELDGEKRQLRRPDQLIPEAICYLDNSVYLG